MKLEFNLCEINEDSRLFKMASEYNTLNEFIIIGEETIDNKEYFKVEQLTNDGIKLIGGLSLDQMAFSIEKSEVKLKGESWYKDTVEIDIPKEHLTMEIIENIQRLNQ